MINYSKEIGKVVTIVLALTMMAPVGLTYTGGEISLADFPPTVTVNTPGLEEQIYNGTINIYWLATDQEENDTLLDITIDYSPDGGTNWFTIMSGTDNNNPPYAWDTIAAGVPDGVSYNFNITATDNASQSGSDTSYMFSIDNTPNDRWYLQIESFNLGGHLDLDMKPSEPEVQEFIAGISAQGDLQIRSFASMYVAPDLMDLAGDWTFSINAKVSSSVFDGLLYANVYADDGATSRLLFTTDNDDENVNPYLDYHEFGWIYTVPPGTLVYMGEQVVVEIMLNATSDPSSTTYYHYADADIPVLGNVSGDYNMTFASDNLYETIEEVDGGVRPNTVILDEDFSTMYPPDPHGYVTWPPGWRVIDGGPPWPAAVPITWRKQVTGSQNPVPPMAYPFAYVRSVNRIMDEQLITPVYDLTFATSVTFEFDQFYDDNPGTDEIAQVDVSSSLTNGSWQTVLNNSGQNSPNPDHQNINITTWAAGALDVEIRFYYVATDGVDWMVDNVLMKATIVNTSLLEHKWTVDVPAGEEPYEFNVEAFRKLNNGDDDFSFAFSTDDVNYIDMVTIDHHGERTLTYWLPPTLSGTVYIRVQDTNRISDYDLSRIEIDQMFISSFSGPRLTIGFDNQSTPSFVEPALSLGLIAYLCIQDAPGGTGTNVTTHNMDTSETFTVWAIGYDSSWNYVSDIRVNWTNTLNNQTSTSSTIFTLDPAVPGSGIITATFNATTNDTTGLITVELFDFPPNVSVLTPGVEDQIYNGTISINWIATDNEDANPTLDITIAYSPDGGTNWVTIMSGTDNNNPPYAWDTVAAGVLDGVSYKFKIIVTDNANKSDSDTSYMFSIDNIPNDRWYLQIESMNLGTHLDLDMKPSESAVQEISVNIPTPGEIPIQTFASEYAASHLMSLMGVWNFSIFAKVSSSDADGNLYANVYADDGVTQRLLFTTDYDDEDVGSYLNYHEFAWSYLVPPGTWIHVGEHIIVELILHTTAGSNSTTNLHYVNADIPVLGNVNGDYILTFVSDNQHEIIEEIVGSPSEEVAVIYEDFSGTWPPAGWHVVNDGGGKIKWSTDNPRNQTPRQPISEPFAIVDYYTRTDTDEQLITPTMDFSFATSVTLEFFQYWICGVQTPMDSYVDVRSSLTSGVWVTLLHQTGPDSPNPQRRTFNISPYAAGSSDVEIRFYIVGRGYACWIVDNVLVTADIVNTSLLEHKWTIDLPANENPYEFNVEANRQLINGDDNFLFSYSTDDISYVDMVLIDHHGDSTKTFSLPPSLSGTIFIRVEDTNRNSDYDVSSIEIDQMFISSVSAPKLTIGFDNQSVPSFVEPVLTLGPIAFLCIQDAPGGNGTNVTTHTMDTSETLTVWAIGYDSGWNYVSDIRANWTNTLNSQITTTSTAFTLVPTTPGSGIITAIYNTTISDTTGLITVELFDFPPYVLVLTPVVEDQICYGPIYIDWIATDNEDSDPTLDITIEYSPDGGTNWYTIMSGTDNNNPPFVWDTVAAGVSDDVHYKFNVTATDNANKSEYDTSYMFSIDNISDDRWYLQIESMNLGTHFDLDMKPSESAVQEISVEVPTPGEFPVQTFASEFVANGAVNLEGDWNFSVYAKVSSNLADGNLYANVYADDGVAQRLLFTTDYDDEYVGSYPTYHEFVWAYSVPPGTMILTGEHVVVEIMLHATAGSSSLTKYHHSDADIPMQGDVSGDYTLTHVSDNQHEIIEEIRCPRGEYAIIDEDFNGTFPPAGWQVVNGGTGTVKWTTDNPLNRTPNPNIYELFAIVDGSIKPTGPFEEQLITPVMDLSSATSITLAFDMYLYSPDPFPIGADVGVRSNLTGGNWKRLGRWLTDSQNPEHEELNITQYAAGCSEVEIRFYLHGPYGESFWIVDNVLVNAIIVNTPMLEHKWTIDLPADEEPYEFNVEAFRKLNNGDDDFVFAYSLDDVHYTDMVAIDHHQDSTKTFPLPSPPPSGTMYIRVRDTNRYSDYDISRIEIDHMYITSVGAPKITIGFDNYTTPSFIEPAFTFPPIAYLCIQDSPGGIGNNVTTQTMTTDDIFTVWAIGFDAGWNYVSNIQANWTNTLNSQTATSSTVFTLDPTAPGVGTITADFNATLSDTTGLITVTLGLLDYIIIRDSPGGLGNEVGAYSMTTDDILTVWSAGYDADGNYMDDINCNWSTNGTLDSQSTIMVNTFTFDPSTAGTSGYILAVNGSLFDSAGLITVGFGILNQVVIRDGSGGGGSGGGGSEVGDTLMVLGQTLTVYSAGYDADNNYIGDIPCNWTTTGTLNLTTASSSISFTFEPAAAGEIGTVNATFNGTISDETGTITVITSGIDYIVIEDGLGNEITTHTMDTSETLTVWAIGYNITVGEVCPVYADWTTTGTLDLQTGTISQSFTFDPINAPTSGTIEGLYGILWDTTGTITVNTGPLTYLCIQDAPGGTGTNVTTHTMTTDETFTVWSIGYDADWNYISDIPSNWTNTLNAQTATISPFFTLDPTAPGSGTITAVFNATLSDTTGLITVTESLIDYIRIEDGLGNQIFAHTMDTTETFTVWAIGYNFTLGEIGPVNADWTTTVTLDLQTATASPTFTFDPIHAPRLGVIIARYALEWDQTGPITVNPGPLANICIQDAPGGAGTNVTTHTMNPGETFTVWAIGYDAEWNYIGNVNCDWATTGALDLQTATGVNTFTFSPVNPGTGTITADFNATISDETGLITVIAPIPTFDIDITLAAGSNGWILISFPNQIEGNPLTLIVDAVDEGTGLVTWDVVQWFDPQSAPGTEWKTTATFKPPQLNTFNYVNNTYSFWIHITNYGDGNLTIQGDLATVGEWATIELIAGWNLVGYPHPTAQAMIGTLGILTNLDMPVETYDPAEPYRLRTADISTEDHEPGCGYWVHLAADEVLSIQCP